MVLKCLNSIIATIADPTHIEVLLQDDASPDYDLRELVGSNQHISVERNEINLGFIRNVNTAAKRAHGDVLCLLNQDILCTQADWHLPMMALLDNPKVGIVGPKLVFPSGGIQSCGGLYDINKNPYHRYLGWQDINDRRVNTTEEVKWVTGACLMIRREDFWRCGGLNDIDLIFGYFDDPWLCNQVRHELGKQIWYCAESVLLHSVGSTGGSKHFLHNMLAFHKRWDDKIVPDSNTIEVNF